MLVIFHQQDQQERFDQFFGSEEEEHGISRHNVKHISRDIVSSCGVVLNDSVPQGSQGMVKNATIYVLYFITEFSKAETVFIVNRIDKQFLLKESDLLAGAHP